MFAQLATMQCLPNTLDQLVERYEKDVIPHTQAQLGYRGLYLLLDRGSGKVVALSLWDSEEDATAYSESVGHQEHLTACASYLAATPAREDYEVSVDA